MTERNLAFIASANGLEIFLQKISKFRKTIYSKFSERIPEKYTCDGENINPPLEILNIPENTKAMVLIIDDPDAPSGNFDHWILFNVPSTTTKIEENSFPDNSIHSISVEYFI